MTADLLPDEPSEPRNAEPDRAGRRQRSRLRGHALHRRCTDDDDSPWEALFRMTTNGIPSRTQATFGSRAGTVRSQELETRSRSSQPYRRSLSFLVCLSRRRSTMLALSVVEEIASAVERGQALAAQDRASGWVSAGRRCARSPAADAALFGHEPTAERDGRRLARCRRSAARSAASWCTCPAWCAGRASIGEQHKCLATVGGGTAAVAAPPPVDVPRRRRQRAACRVA